MAGKDLKVAILHDWLVGFRGGERMLEALCEMYPQADIYTLIHKKGSVPESIERHTIYCSFLNTIPGIYEHYRKFLPLFPAAVDTLRFRRDYDLVISSTHCVIKGMGTPAGAKHIAYVYTPMRYMYDQFDIYFGKDSPLYQQWGARAVRSYITNWDKESNAAVDAMVGISEFVKKRIADVYNISADVIYPFVDLKDFAHLNLGNKKSEDYYLMVSAFAPNKRVDLAVEVFNRNGKRLKIVGGGQQEKMLRAQAKPNIEFLGASDRETIVELYFRAKGFLFPGIEDFGITPLESLAAGTPVIAYSEGGVLETMTSDTAEFFDKQTPEALQLALDRFERRSFLPQQLKERALLFSKDRFMREMGAFVQNKLEVKL